MVVKLPPRRTSSFVVSAIRKLRDVQGSTSRDIVNFISSAYDISDPSLKRHVQMALKRGLNYGIINRGKGGYYLANPKSLALSSEGLVEKRGGACKKKRRRSKCAKRRRKSKSKKRKRRKSKCGKKKRRKSKCAKRRSRRKCGKKKRPRKKICEGESKRGEDEMDQMGGMNRLERRAHRAGRSRYSGRGIHRKMCSSEFLGRV